jgi:cyclic pyranopterin phosphate synthase
MQTVSLTLDARPIAAEPLRWKPEPAWRDCRFMSCSALPVRVACNLSCPFCFSKSSVSALRHERADWRAMDVSGYYAIARERGASRLVITGGGEPLLRPADVLHLIRLGRRDFDEIACFTNGTFLSADLARQLADAGLSYVCYSRHHEDDATCRGLMGDAAPTLDTFFAAAVAGGLKVRATCVMARGYVDSAAGVWRYVRRLADFGVREFTFKHTYVAYAGSVFCGSPQDRWAAEHQVEFDPFEDQGEDNVVGRLPWGPKVRRIGDYQLCYYREPTPAWELENRICRSSNLLSDGSVYASLEERRSLLFRLSGS